VSYDGTVKLWDIGTMKCIGSVGGGEGVLYCASWAPGSSSRIVTSSSVGKIFVMECEPGEPPPKHSSTRGAKSEPQHHLDSSQLHL